MNKDYASKVKVIESLAETGTREDCDPSEDLYGYTI